MITPNRFPVCPGRFSAVMYGEAERNRTRQLFRAGLIVRARARSIFVRIIIYTHRRTYYMSTTVCAWYSWYYYHNNAYGYGLQTIPFYTEITEIWRILTDGEGERKIGKSDRGIEIRGKKKSKINGRVKGRLYSKYTRTLAQTHIHAHELADTQTSACVCAPLSLSAAGALRSLGAGHVASRGAAAEWVFPPPKGKGRYIYFYGIRVVYVYTFIFFLFFFLSRRDLWVTVFTRACTFRRRRCERAVYNIKYFIIIIILLCYYVRTHIIMIIIVVTRTSRGKKKKSVVWNGCRSAAGYDDRPFVTRVCAVSSPTWKTTTCRRAHDNIIYTYYQDHNIILFIAGLAESEQWTFHPAIIVC